MEPTGIDYMNESQPYSRSVLYVITCGSSSAPLVEGFVKEAQAAGWDVCVMGVPQILGNIQAKGKRVR